MKLFRGMVYMLYSMNKIFFTQNELRSNLVCCLLLLKSNEFLFKKQGHGAVQIARPWKLKGVKASRDVLMRGKDNALN